jgi:hypothetical protein
MPYAPRLDSHRRSSARYLFGTYLPVVVITGVAGLWAWRGRVDSTRHAPVPPQGPHAAAHETITHDHVDTVTVFGPTRLDGASGVGQTYLEVLPPSPTPERQQLLRVKARGGLPPTSGGRHAPVWWRILPQGDRARNSPTLLRRSRDRRL